ncbi:MAG: protein kinase [Phycisphaerales bacterium]|nr:protein kinase [Phycisphaerales bacterium]
MSEAPGNTGRESSAREHALIDAARRQAEGLGTSMTPQEGLPPADAFPNYQLIRELHRGGQGVVYLAIQITTRRKVAIKVMREGPYAGGPERTRFEREVQILAQLKHPNIVGIHDSGVANGAFFYVMDYISGQTLDSWTSGEPRPIPEALALFLKVCDAVAAAHLKGVIHRDIKPANIRVDNAGEPQVVDFGLAKTISGDVVESDREPVMMTMTGQFVGSLPWASPEQAEGLPDKIDVRTDVYSLGVVLYQLLTGRFPYQVAGNMRDVLDRILRAEPARPSTIRRKIDDEIETIVLKCLAKDRERRYQSAGELARDLRHYLAGEPIEAKRDSGWYVLKKALRRYRPYATVAAGFAILLVGFGIALAVQNRELARANTQLSAANDKALRSNQQLELANQQLESANKELSLARTRAETARDASLEVFGLIDPSQARGAEITLREAMVQAESQMRERLKDMPEALADLTQMFGQLHTKLGDNERGLRLTREAQRLRAAGGAYTTESLMADANEAVMLRGRRYPGDLAEAERILRSTLEMARRHPELVSPSQRSVIEHNLARCFDGSLGPEPAARLEEARGLFESVLATLAGEPDSEEKSEQIVATRTHLAAMQLRAGRYDDAERSLAAAMDELERRGGGDPSSSAKIRGYLARVRLEQGRADEADELHRAAIDDLTSVLGPRHPEVLEITANYARFLGNKRIQRYESAVTVWDDILDRAGSHPGMADSIRTADWLRDSAEPLIALKQPAKAEQRLLAASEIVMDSQDPLADDRRRAIAARLAVVCETLGRAEDAARYRAAARPAGAETDPQPDGK